MIYIILSGYMSVYICQSSLTYTHKFGGIVFYVQYSRWTLRKLIKIEVSIIHYQKTGVGKGEKLI